MKLSLTAFLVTLACVTGTISTVKAQHVYQIRADSVRIYNVCDTAELIIENRTRGVSGYLFNKGGGRTEFRKIDLVQVGGSKLAIAGQDTIDLAQLSGVGGIDTIYRAGDSIRYVKKGITKGVYAPVLASADLNLQAVTTRGSSTTQNILFNAPTANPSNGLMWQYNTDSWRMYVESLQDKPSGNLIFEAKDDIGEGWVFRHVLYSPLDTTSVLSMGRDRFLYMGDQIWHAGNHAAGALSTKTFTTAQVPASIETNASGHVTAITTRTLTAADIGALATGDTTRNILNRTGPAQAANFNISGYGRITRNGSSSFSTGFMLVPATGPGSVNMQLTGDAVPGMAIWTHDGTKQRLHSAFHANGTFSKYGDSGIIALSQLGTELTFSRDGANYIRATGPNGYFDFLTGGAVTSDITSAFTLYADKTAVFRGPVRMDSLPAKATAASRLLTVENGVVSTRTPNQLLADMSGLSRIAATANPLFITPHTGNLDSITNSGIFHIGVATNRPSTQPAFLFAGGNNTGASNFKFQLLGAYSTEDEMFYRQGNPSATWGNWYQVASRQWADASLIRNGTAAQTANFNITGTGTIGTTISQLLLSNNSNAGLTLIGGSTATSGSRGGQIVLFGGTHSSNAGQITFHAGQGSGGTPQNEVMRIMQDGKIGIGTDAPASLLHVNGNVTATAYYQSSLRSLKKEIQPFAGSALRILGSAKVRSFIFKADTTGHRSIGFIADEVPAEIATPGNNGVDQANVVGLLVKAIQELKAEKDAMEAQLKAKNEALEARLSAIEALLKSK
ncbi:tail fiber domain-containing protein [Chitinophaga caseinilytica]|uniref:tail fiber domain-containing protein n=1 Tax=Chitinophaga caseinilytica TaxID=2267521 RepID=UPI003C2C5EA7